MTPEGAGGSPAGGSPEGLDLSEPEVREARAGDGSWRLRAWEGRWPDLAAGITGSGEDYGLAGGADAWTTTERYEALGRRMGFATVVVGRQVHGPDVRTVAPPSGGGVLVSGEADGHVSASPGTLLTATAADCVPAYLLAPERRAWGLVHGGWRGIAAGVLESAFRELEERHGARREALRLHLGPAICGECYEVGHEVVEALGSTAAILDSGGAGARPRVDLRRTLQRRAMAAGLRRRHVTRSAWCTCCSGDHFHSYRCRGESPARMAAFLGWRGEESRPGNGSD